jgi:hypothetical protein
MNNEERDAKIDDIKKHNTERLLTCTGKAISSKEQLFEMIKEARAKGYTILVADGFVEGIFEQGIVLFKEIDGVELAYNPRWKDGAFCYDTKTLLEQSRCLDFWQDNVGDIAIKATELIQIELAKYGIKLEDKEEDLFYVPIFNALEKFSNGNYRSDM